MKKNVFILLILLFTLPSLAKKDNGFSRAAIRCEDRMYAGIEAFNSGRYSRAINFLSIVRNECSGEIDEPDSIYYFLGLSYMKAKKFEDARMEFRTVIEEFPHSEFIEQIYYLIAYNSFRDSPIIQRDNRLLNRAEREFASFISAYPNSEWADSAKMYIDSISNKLLEKEILSAEYYEIVHKYESAIIYYESILQDYIGHNKIPEIRLRLAQNLVMAKRFSEAEEQMTILENENLFENEIESLRKRQNTEIKRRKR